MRTIHFCNDEVHTVHEEGSESTVYEYQEGYKDFALLQCPIGKNHSPAPQSISCSCAKNIAEGGKACACATLIHPRAIANDKTGGRYR